MAKLTINIGQSANDKNGDPLRTAFTKVNANFDELYAGAANETQLTNGSYTATNMVLYSGPIFQYGSTNKISSAITLIPLATTFTAV